MSDLDETKAEAMSTSRPETERRRLLHAADRLLDQVERLRLLDRRRTPPELQSQIATLAGEIGVPVPARPPQALVGAQDLVFRMQRVLMRGAGNPRIPRGLSTAAPRPALPPLALPDQEAFDSWEAWIDRMQLTVQRACDRARYLDAQAGAARRLPDSSGRVLAEQRGAEAAEARQNWQELAREAEQRTGHPVSLDLLPDLPKGGRLQLGDVAIDLNAREVRKGGELVPLTTAEFSYFVILAANPDRVLSREAIQQLVNGDDPHFGARSRAIDVHLAHVRTKLGGEYLETVRSIGFRGRLKDLAAAAEPRANARQLRERAWARRSEWEQRRWAGPSEVPPPLPGRDLQAGT